MRIFICRNNWHCWGVSDLYWVNFKPISLQNINSSGRHPQRATRERTLRRNAYLRTLFLLCWNLKFVYSSGIFRFYFIETGLWSFTLVQGGRVSWLDRFQANLFLDFTAFLTPFSISLTRFSSVDTPWLIDWFMVLHFL